MKNKLFILLLLLLTGNIQTNAQDYIPMLGDTNVWTYAHWPWEWVDIISTEDSVYNGLTYKKILHEGWGLTGLLREDTINQQIWYIEPDSLNERIIYDFSLQEGDSIWLQYNADVYGGMLQDGWYFVDSIRTKTFFEINRRVFYLDNPLNDDLSGFGSTRPYIEWIEGVGSNLHPTYFVIKDCAADGCGIDFIYGASIFCAYKNNIHIYEDCMLQFFYEWTCFGPSDIINLSENQACKIFPNPANNELFIKTETFSFGYDILLRDLYGKIVKHSKIKKKETRIDISNLTPGIYFITVSNKKNTFTQKIIKL